MTIQRKSQTYNLRMHKIMKKVIWQRLQEDPFLGNGGITKDPLGPDRKVGSIRKMGNQALLTA